MTTQEVIEKTKHLDGVKIEMIGTWIWISGKTYQHKEYLKELGLFFSGKKQAWFFNGQLKKHKTMSNYKLPDLRNLHYTQTITNNDYVGIDNPDVVAVA